MNETRADQIEAAFRRFHVDNPNVWVLFERFTFEAIAAGMTSYSSAAIFERISSVFVGTWTLKRATPTP